MSDAGQTQGPKTPEIERSVYVRRPAVLGLVAFAGGFCVDRYLLVTFSSWLIFFTAVAVACLVIRFLPATRRRQVFTVLSCLALVLCTGGIHHHIRWTFISADDVSRYCTLEGQPVRIRGVLSSALEIREAKFGPRIPAWMELDRSTCHFEAEAIQSGTEWHSVSGTLSLSLDGHVVHVGVGDRVEIFGRLSRPEGPRNPGDPDFRKVLRHRGLTGLLRVEHPRAVTLLDHLDSWRWRATRLRHSIRRSARSQLEEHLSEHNRAIATSILIGDRLGLTDELREQFAESGTMHLLAISGLHVAIFLGMAAVLCRFLNLGSRTTAVCLILLLVTYAFLTNHRPPVFRATILAAIALLGAARGRSVDGINLLAAVGLILLIWHPSDLFDIGAQLSFLAVATILWAMKAWPPSNLYEEPDPLRPERSAFVEWLIGFGKIVGRMYLITTCIWVVTTPLTVATFHLAAPIGTCLNVLLIPFTAVVLAFGYLHLFVGLLIPGGAMVVGPLFDGSLSLFLAVVEWGQALPFGHLYIPDLPRWWLGGYYVLIGSLWLLWGLIPIVRWSFHSIAIWLAIGLVTGFAPTSHDTLRCTFLSVGHGLATIVELPGGQTLLYDAGTIGDGTRAERIVERALWSKGVFHVDAIVVSHADHDHYSGVFGILEKFSVGTMFVHQSAVGEDQTGILELCELAASNGVSIEFIQAGDRLMGNRIADPSVSIDVIHPPANFHSKSDNANSLVLAVEFADRRIVLTGDIEREGLAAMLAGEPRPCDVLLAPHHGGKAANVPQLYEWADPDDVVVSSGDLTSRAGVTAAAAKSTVLMTAESGAVSCEIDSGGRLTVDGFLDGKRDER